MFKKLWEWYYKNYINEDNTKNDVKLKNLIWISKNIYSKRNVPFGYINSIRFDVEKILTKEEVVIDVTTIEQATEVLKCVVQN